LLVASMALALRVPRVRLRAQLSHGRRGVGDRDPASPAKPVKDVQMPGGSDGLHADASTISPRAVV